MIKQKRIQGFTLIEVLLVTSLMAIISLAVFHSLANGLKVWQISNRYAQEEDISIFFDKISQDLKNSFYHSLIKFEGNESELGFATIVRTSAGPGQGDRAEYAQQIGRVEYQFDRSKGTLFRRQADYGQALKEKMGPPRVMAHSLTDVKFSYYQTESEHTVLKDKTEAWPKSILVEVTFSNNKGVGQNSLSKVVTIPSGNEL